MNNSFRILATDIYMNNNTFETGLNNNDLIIGPSGAGKTRGYVKPNIMQCNDSMIIADTKSSLHHELAPLLLENGYQVININFKDLGNSYGYNPFDFVRYDEYKGKYNEQDIMTIASTLCPSTLSHDPFWENAAKMYLSCFIAYVLECLPKDEHHLESVRQLIILMNKPELSNLMFELENDNPSSFALRQYKMFENNHVAEKMNQSIIGVLVEKINDLLLDDLISMYQASDRIDFQKIGNTKTAVFLSISDTDRSMDRLTSLFYTQALQILCNTADTSPTNRLTIPVRFFFDDFATNTIIPDFDNIISVIRSREIYVSIILQNITQLNAIYGEDKASTIINNCDNCLYLGGQDLKTAEFVAIRTNRSTNDILNMPLSHSYLFTRGNAPQQVKKFDLTTHDNYQHAQELVAKREALPQNINEPVTVLYEELPFN